MIKNHNFPVKTGHSSIWDDAYKDELDKDDHENEQGKDNHNMDGIV